MSDTLSHASRARKRRKPAAPPFSAGFIETADIAVRSFLQGSSTLNTFLANAAGLTQASKLRIVEQALVLIEGLYVHLPLKRAMHAVDPVQRLRLLKQRLAAYASDARFHAEMVDIFTSVRDLHTNYLLPRPFADVTAFLPFRVEACREAGKRVYMVGGVAPGFTHPTFKAGVEIRYWNGVPIDRAVEAVADRHAGSNLDARHSRGVAGLTIRPLIIAPPPDEEWVIVGYRTSDGADLELKFDWLVAGLPGGGGGEGDGGGAFATARGDDLETILIQNARRVLFAPQTEAKQASLNEAVDPLALVQGLESTLPKVFAAREVQTAHGTFGHLRIWTFSADPDQFVDEFIRLVGLLPQNGLILDVRDNGGGVIHCGELLLQLLTPGRIEPEPVQFINTPLTLKLCEAHATGNPNDIDLSPWLPSMQRAVETGAAFSASFPITSRDQANDRGQHYCGPIVLITSARCYSTTDIFAAGFQDHAVGPILGVDGNTGAGGANVWTHELLSQLLPGPNSPIKALPTGSGMRVSIRRTLRVGPQAGTEVEDLGVVPDHRHELTRADVLQGNTDLMETAGELLADKPSFGLSVQAAVTAGVLRATVKHAGVERLDVYVDGRPAKSQPVTVGAQQTQLELPFTGALCRVEGYRGDKLVAARQEAVG